MQRTAVHMLGRSCLKQQLSGAGGILVRKHFETVDWSEWGCRRLARYQPVPQLISQAAETSQTAVEHFNSSLKSAARTWAADFNDPLPASAAEKNDTHGNTTVADNSAVPQHPHGPFLTPAVASPSTAQGHNVDIAYQSLNELIKGAASEVLLHFVYLCITEAPQITQTKGLSELLI